MQHAAHKLGKALSTAVRRLKRTVNSELNQLSYNRQALNVLGEAEVFQVELTNHCPMTCVMCPRTESMTRALGYMDEGLFQRIIREISPYTSKVFLHHFGDSLVHPKLGAFIHYANQYRIKSYLSTNAALLTEKRARSLVDSGLYELVVSLDGVSAETNIAIRGKAAQDVADAERKVRYLLKYRQLRNSRTPRLIMQFVRQKLNYQETDEWLAKWKAVEGVDEVKIKSYISWDGQDDRINALRIAPAPRADKVVCDKPWTSVTILWDGRVVPCCFDYDGKYVLGDLRHQSLAEIWRGERMRSLRRAHQTGRHCDVSLCARCTDKEGYPVGKWYYPLNRFLQGRFPLGDRDKV
jgi:radical SAM protein with 4Fe4S-binding SPASM domain